MSLPQYIIQVDNKYFVGVSDKVIGTTGDRNTWYAQARDMYALQFAKDKNKAKLIEGNINLNSYMKKIQEHNQRKTIQFNKLIIEKVGEV